jgi:UDPglucose 6-dehydrogenase
LKKVIVELYKSLVAPIIVTNLESFLQNIKYGQNPYETANDSDVQVLITECEEFKNLDLAKINELLKQPIIIDCRNIYDTARVRELGFLYEGVGR